MFLNLLVPSLSLVVQFAGDYCRRLSCPSITYTSGRLKKTVIREGKNNLAHFAKGLRWAFII